MKKIIYPLLLLINSITFYLVSNDTTSYLVPQELQVILDPLFINSDTLKSKRHFEEAGFSVIISRSSGMSIAKHPALPGYLLKLYLNSSNKPDKNIYKRLNERCLGAENVRKVIIKKNLKFFSVPDKWLYFPPQQKNTAILVVTDMNIVSLRESKRAWKNKVTKEHLKELYSILNPGYSSSCLPRNIPYTQSGQFVCIDTEHAKRPPVLSKVKLHLNSEMKSHWDKLVKNKGKIPQK